MPDFDPNVTQDTAPATQPAVDTSVPTTTVQSTPPAATSPGQATSPAQPGSQPVATNGAPEGWVPPHRLRETREAAQRQVYQAQKQYEEAVAKITELENKVRALAGFGPQPNPEIEGIRQQFAHVFPGLARLDDSKIEALLQMVERMPDFDQQNSHYWNSHGQRSLSTLYKLAEEDLGQALTDEAKDHLHKALIGYVGSSPELIDAYAEDPNFIPQFWKAWSSNFIEPVRRVSAASAQTRAGLPTPQDVPGQTRTTPAPKPGSPDERLAMAWTAYQNTRRS